MAKRSFGLGRVKPNEVPCHRVLQCVVLAPSGDCPSALAKGNWLTCVPEPTLRADVLADRFGRTPGTDDSHLE
jgi:hypothetical protein